MKDVFVCLLMMLVAVFGSCAKWLDDYKTNPGTLLQLSVGAGCSAFSGLMVGFLHFGFGLNIWISLSFAGSFGFLGGNGIIIGIKYFFGRVGLKMPDDE